MFHDMEPEARRARYTSLLRARQKEQTAVLILEAVASILRREDLPAVTVAEVARVAEVTERTIYRHFKTRDALLRAFWPWQLKLMTGGAIKSPRSFTGFLNALREVFAAWDRDEKLVRAVFFSAESHKIRAPTTTAILNYIRGFLVEMLPKASETERHDVAAAIMSLCTVANWIFMRDVCGFSGPRAADATLRGVRLILAGAGCKVAEG